MSDQLIVSHDVCYHVVFLFAKYLVCVCGSYLLKKNFFSLSFFLYEETKLMCFGIMGWKLQIFRTSGLAKTRNSGK